MKMFRELSAYAEPDALESMIAKLESGLSDGWLRDREGEARVRPLCSDGQICVLFTRPAKAKSPETVLAMTKEGRRVFVANIFPKQHGEISREVYNSILTEFYLKFLHPAASEAGVAIELSADERALAEPFGGKSAALLKRFSCCANKSSEHPADRSRWLDFLISLRGRSFRAGDFGLLGERLIDAGWSPKKARELVSECYFALDLLLALDRTALLAHQEGIGRAPIE